MDQRWIQEISVADIARQVGVAPMVLVTRPVGEMFSPILEQALDQLPETVAVILDFTGVEVIDGSFTDEIFGKMALRRSRREGPPRCLILQSLGPAVLENLRITLTSRQVTVDRGIRNCVFPALLGGGRVELIGKAERHVLQSFDLLRSRGTLTARDVADVLELDIAAASTRLKVLYDLGLALRTEVRSEQGKEYLYSWPL
jgi:DNA-binding transcriptional ArsR family regulator